MEGNNIKSIRPRHGKTILFPSLPNKAFQLVGEELTLAVPQFHILQADNTGFIMVTESFGVIRVVYAATVQ